MVARSAGCEQQALSTASLAASSNRDPHYVRLITDDATDFASKIRCSQKPSYSKLYSLTVPVSLRDYFCGCYRANTSVRPYGFVVLFIMFFCAHILCALFFCLILFWANTRCVRPNYSCFLILGVVIGYSLFMSVSLLTFCHSKSYKNARHAGKIVAIAFVQEL